MKVQRWRVRFSKTAAMRYTGHLDLILTWERTFRRSGLPLSYSQGYNPRPVINLAAPLPLGFISRGELGDFWLSQPIDEQSFKNELIDALPPGLEISSVQEIAEIHGNKLPTLVRSAIYSVSAESKQPDLAGKISRFLTKSESLRTRKGKEYDLRSLVKDLTLLETGPTTPTRLSMELSLLPGATGRPDEVLNELGIPVYQSVICREKIILQI